MLAQIDISRHFLYFPYSYSLILKHIRIAVAGSHIGRMAHVTVTKCPPPVSCEIFFCQSMSFRWASKKC